MTRPNIIKEWGVIRPLIVLSTASLLAACSLTPAQQASTISTVATAAVTLAQVAGKNNQTVQTLLADGALICGEASSVPGQLLEGSAVAVLNALGVPVSVTGQLAADVAAACPAGLVPGPAPADQTTIPVASSTTTLPPVPVS